MGFSLLAAFVAWHAVFDVTLHYGMHEYLDRHALHARGAGPAVTIHGVMDAALRRGTWYGLAAAAAVLAAAWGLARWRGARGQRPVASSQEQVASSQ